jgi:DNA-directed RNA polymerase specialized sigma24 family protein
LQSAYLLFLERYNGVGEPLAWLYTTVKREVWAIGRRGSRQRECSATVAHDDGEQFDLFEGIATGTPGPQERVERAESVRGRRESLAALKQDERRALLLLAFGLSYAEICDVTGWTYSKVNRCVSEGRAALRRAEEFDVPRRQ